MVFGKNFVDTRITKMETTGTLSARGNDLTQGSSENDEFTSGEVVKGRTGERMGRAEE